MKQLSIGKIRGLQRTSSKRGVFSVCAMDHRNNLRHLLNPIKPDKVTIGEMIHFKMDLARSLAPASSAVLLDPEWSAAQGIANGVIPPSTGVIVAVEATGYSGNPDARQSRILPGWSVAKAKRMGADAVKLLVYYHPDSPTRDMVEELVTRTSKDCEREDMAFFLEPLSYSLDVGKKCLDPQERRKAIIETARRLSPLGADVLKMEIPIDIGAQPDESDWIRACEELSKQSHIPWILLSASVGFETYLRQAVIAAKSGASGVAVGRAVWKEAAELSGQERSAFLNGEALMRMKRISEIVEDVAVPWTNIYQSVPVGEEWYKTYPDHS